MTISYQPQHWCDPHMIVFLFLFFHKYHSHQVLFRIRLFNLSLRKVSVQVLAPYHSREKEHLTWEVQNESVLRELVRFPQTHHTWTFFYQYYVATNAFMTGNTQRMPQWPLRTHCITPMKVCFRYVQVIPM